MSKLQLFARLTKVDEATRKVYGVIASETPDRAKEVFDYASSKPNFENWSNDIAKATDGKSLGNVRAMHGKVAAGRITEIVFDDVQKTISVEADIVDDAEWNKLTKGLYTGFSIGGKYVRKWDDNGVKRYEALPSEVSIVDYPCNKDASFTVMKADGASEEASFDESVTSGEGAPVEAGEDEGNAEGVSNDASASAAHKAADSELNASATPAAGELRLVGESLEKFVDGAWVVQGTVTPTLSGEDLTKGAYSISSLARLADDCASLCNYRAYEVAGYPDNGTEAMKQIPQSLKDAASSLYDALLAIVSEDVEKAKAIIAEKMAEGDLAKTALDARIESLDALDALCKAVDVNNIGELAKGLAKVAGQNVELRTQVEDLRKQLSNTPLPAKGVLRVVDKAGDSPLAKSDGTTATASVDATPEELTKAAFAQALSNPVRIGH